MEMHEKLRYRAWLLAIGADRWYDCTDRIERMKTVEILEEEFARAKASGEPLEKERAFLAKHGIVISDIPVHLEVPVSREEQEKVDLGHGEQACRTLTSDDVQAVHSGSVHSGTTSSPEVHENAECSQGEVLGIPSKGYSWNRVPPAIEEAVRERFAEGWSKSRLAREFRLNRRTVIRICTAKEKVNSAYTGLRG